MGRFLGPSPATESGSRRGRGYAALPEADDVSSPAGRPNRQEGVEEEEVNDVRVGDAEGNARQGGDEAAGNDAHEDGGDAVGAEVTATATATASGSVSATERTTEVPEQIATTMTQKEDGEVDTIAGQAVSSTSAVNASASSNNNDDHREEEEGEPPAEAAPEPPLPPGFIRLRILDLNGKFFNIACQLEWTVSALKSKVQECTDVAVISQRLIYRGRVLEDDHDLASYKVEHGHTIHLFVRMNQPPDADGATATATSGAATASNEMNHFHDGATMTIVHINSETISSAVFPSDSARRVDPLMLDSPLGNCARRVKLWSSFLLIIYTMKVMGQFALLANDQQQQQQARNEEANKDPTTPEVTPDPYDDRYNYPPYYDQDPLVSAIMLVVHAFGVYVGCVGFKAAHDTDIRPIRFYCRGVVWLAILTVAEQIYITVQISQADLPDERIQYPYGPAAPSKDDIVSANIFQTMMLVIMWIMAIHHSYAHQAEIARYNESFAAAAMNAPPPAQLPEVVA